MNATELRKEMTMDYNTLVKYLQEKYGKPARAYFRTTACKSKSPITRGDEGLYIHHVQEVLVDNLNTQEQALAHPWEYQEPDNLCYCNHLEHLLLHLKINIIRTQRNNSFVIDGVLNFIVPELNHNYLNKPVYTTKNMLWKNTAFELIQDNYKEYQEMVEEWIQSVKNYTFSNHLSLSKVLTWKGFSSRSLTQYEALIEFMRHFTQKESKQ